MHAHTPAGGGDQGAASRNPPTATLQPASQPPPTDAPVTVLTKQEEVATMERPGSMIRVRPREETRSRTVSIRSLGVGRMSPLRTRVGLRR